MIKIPFYEDSYFSFSNFSANAIKYNGVIFPTVEHAFHYAKFDDEKIQNEILNAESPLKAYLLGKKYKPHRRTNWDDIKIDILYNLILRKAQQHEEFRTKLIGTGDKEIIEDNPDDDFWGNGKDGNGENQTGKILMRIREELRKNALI